MQSSLWDQSRPRQTNLGRMEVPRIAVKEPNTQAAASQSVAAAQKSANSKARFGLDCPRRGPALLWLVIVLAAAAAILTHQAVLGKFDRQLKIAVTDRLKEAFSTASVHIGGVAFNDQGKLVVNDLRMAVVSSENRKLRQVISCERAVMSGDLDIAHWVQQTIQIKQIDLHGVQIDMWPQGESKWSVQELKPTTQPNTRAPTIVVHDAMMKVFPNHSPRSTPIVLHDIQGVVAPKIPTLTEQCSPTALSINFAASSSGVMRRLTLQGWFDPLLQAWKANGVVENFEFTHELIEKLPPEAATHLNQIAGLECEASFSYDLFSRPQSSPGFEVKDGVISDGRLRDSRLPYPLDHLRGKFYCNNSKLQLRDLVATSGSTTLTLGMDIEGFSPNVPITIFASATGLELDRRLYDSLPATYRTYWDRLQLEGLADATLNLMFDGKRYSTVATFDCRDVSMTPWLFPYRLEKVTGKVTYADDRVSSELLTGMAGGQPVQGALLLSSIGGGQWVGEVACRTLGAVAVDEKLLAALTPVGAKPSPTENFVRTLHPTGVVQLTSATFKRSSTPGDTWHRSIDASIYNGKIRYDGFDYPIYEIRGRIEGKDDEWRLDQFEGRNSSSRIQCNGSWLAVKNGPVPLDLQFRALAVQLDEELEHALPPDAQFLWKQLQPVGAMDAIDVRLLRPSPSEPVALSVSLREESTTNEASGRSLRLYPREFPFWLTDVACNVTYSPGRIHIESASASNGASRILVKGDCTRDAEKKQWIADMHWLPSTRLIVNNQFLQALPATIRQSLVRLDFRGPVSVLGNSRIVLTPGAEQGITSSWNCQLDIEDAQLGEGNYVDAMRGSIEMEGKNDGKTILASGKVFMDAVTLKGVPVTHVTGPFALVGSRLFFGSAISEALPQASGSPAAEMTADALAGKLAVSGHGQLDSGKFYVKANLKGAELSAMLQDVGVNRATTPGLCEAEVDFNGVPWNTQTYHGTGSIHLSDAKLYQLPFMIKLLSFTRSVSNDDAAFTSADIKFQMDGDHIPLNVACEGDVLRMVGKGWTNLRREIELDLYTYVGRRNVVRNVIDPLLSESPYASTMMIAVRGSLDSPDMKRVPFPQLESTLQQMFPEVAERRQENPILPWRR